MEQQLFVFLSDFQQNEERLTKLHDLANKLMSIPDIAVLLDVDKDLLALAIRDCENDVAKAYLLGKAERVLTIHESEISLADAGSSQGMDNLHAFLQQMNAAEN